MKNPSASRSEIAPLPAELIPAHYLATQTLKRTLKAILSQQSNSKDHPHTPKWLSSEPKCGIAASLIRLLTQASPHAKLGGREFFPIKLSSACVMDSICLTLTNRAARDFFQNVVPRLRGKHGIQRASNYWDEYDTREHAEAGLNRAIRKSRCNVELEKRIGDRGDPIYAIHAESNFLQNAWICLRVAAGTDCTRIIRILTWNRGPRPNSVTWNGGLSFTTDWEFQEPLPSRLRSMCSGRRSADEIRTSVAKNLEVWKAHLHIAEQAAREQEFHVHYKSRRTAKGKHKYRLIIDEADARAWKLLRPNMNLEISHEDPSREHSRGLRSKVKIKHIAPEDKSLVVQWDSDSDHDIGRIDDRFPRTAYLKSEEVGTRINIQRQFDAIRNLEAGRQQIENLDTILFGQEKVDLAPAAIVDPIPVEECLVPSQINKEQRHAVAEALATPDCYLLQGPPGTGKTTFIAELCFQAAKRGKKVLVSSQTNLAVDNALSRLENNPEILAVRLGPSEKIEEEGLPFVEENAVRRWLAGVGEKCRKSLSRFEDIASIAELSETWRRTLDSWARGGGTNWNTTISESLTVLAREVAHAQCNLSEFEPARQQRELVVAAKRDYVTTCLKYQQRTHAFDQWERFLQGDLNSDLVAQSLPKPAEDVLKRIIRVEASDKAIGGKPHVGKQNLIRLLSDWTKQELRNEPKLAVDVILRIESLFARRRRHASRPIIGWFVSRWLTWASTEVKNASSRLRDVLRAPRKIKCQLTDDFECRIREAQEAVKNAKSNAENKSKVLVSRSEDLRRLLPHIDQHILDCDNADDTLRITNETEIQLKEALDLANARIAAALWQSIHIALGRTLSQPSDSGLAPLLNELSAEAANPERVKSAHQLLGQWATYLEGEHGNIDEMLHDAFNSGVNVVGATTSFAGSMTFRDHGHGIFDFVVIDEVSKATPTELLIPAILGKRLILVGDHKQLNPVFGDEVEGEPYEVVLDRLKLQKHQFEQILKKPLFEDRFNRFHSNPSLRRTRTLPQQYRMHSLIMNGINQFYNGQLRLGFGNQDEKKKHRINSIPWLNLDAHVIWIETPYTPEWRTQSEPGTKSMRNPQEAKVVGSIVRQLLEPLRKRRFTLGVISMYAAQSRSVQASVDRLTIPKSNRDDVDLKISTVDRFQGMERDVIIVSLCANQTRPSSFLRKPNRINVAMSRARSLLIIVGSGKTFCKHQGESSHYHVFRRIAKGCGGYLHAGEILADSGDI